MKKGDFILIDYVGRVAESGEVFDSTREDVAKREKAFIEGRSYGPLPVIIGAGMVIRGVERRLETMEPGKEERFTVQPEEAFGRRSPTLIRIISMSHFVRQRVNPVPGVYVTIDGLRARIQAVSGGRVRVDFNDPLAGKRLEYTVRITRAVTDPKEKVMLLLQRYGIKAETSYNPQTKEVAIESVAPLKNLFQKMLSDMVQKWMPEVSKLTFSVKHTEAKEAQPEEAGKSPEKTGETVSHGP